MNLQIIVAPLVGAAIGYITNYIAIKMLFRPLKPKYIGKWRVPLTPGLIPKEKERLAAAVGDVISANLLDAKTVQGALLSDDMKAKIEGGLDRFIEAHSADERTLRELMAELFTEDGLNAAIFGAREVAMTVLAQKLTDANLGDLAAQAITDHVKKKSPSALSALVSGLLDERIKHSITSQLADGVNGYIRENAQAMLGGAIAGETDKLLNLRACDLIGQHRDKLTQYKQKLIGAYEKLILMGTERALCAIDIAGIIKGRVAGFNERELEQLILSVIKRELSAIVWLGAGLGLIMGFTNLLFS